MVAIYARQSLEVKDSLSVENQIALCRPWAGEEAEVFQDRGYSGKNTNRPAFTRLMEGVRAGRVRRILVYRLDRFSRSIADFSRLWAELERYGVQFQSVTENFDTGSPMGRAMLNIVMTFAQLERETTAERVRDSYRHRVGLGAWPGGPAPYGFLLTKTGDGQGRQVSTLTEGPGGAAVREIFRRYLEPGTSLRSLARALTDQGLPGPRQGAWDGASLSRLLRNPVYVRADEAVWRHYLAQGVSLRHPREAFDGLHGCLLIGKRGQGAAGAGRELALSLHRGLLPAGLWLAVQEKLAGNRPLERSRAGRHSWLTGLLKCGKCGYALRVNLDRRSGKYYLLCSGRSNRGLCDASVRVDLRELEAAVEAALQGVLDRCPAEALVPPAEGRALAELEGQIGRLVAALAQSGETAAAYISREIEVLHGRKQALERALPRTPAACRRRPDLGRADFEEKRAVAGVFLRAVSVAGEDVVLEWNA